MGLFSKYTAGLLSIWAARVTRPAPFDVITGFAVSWMMFTVGFVQGPADNCTGDVVNTVLQPSSTVATTWYGTPLLGTSGTKLAEPFCCSAYVMYAGSTGKDAIQLMFPGALFVPACDCR